MSCTVWRLFVFKIHPLIANNDNRAFRIAHGTHLLSPREKNKTIQPSFGDYTLIRQNTLDKYDTLTASFSPLAGIIPL